MTSPKGTGKIINIKCTEVSLPEFPNLLFGTHFDGSRIFDATYYLQSKDPDNKLSIEDFFHKFDFQIKAIAETYKLPLEKLSELRLNKNVNMLNNQVGVGSMDTCILDLNQKKQAQAMNL